MGNSGRTDHDHPDAALGQRVDYAGDGLDERQLAATPYLQARAWIDAALAYAEELRGTLEPTALSVATVDPAGAPDVRTVLMRRLDELGPAFYTNLDSRKGRDLAGDPRVAAALTWPWQYRAIRFRGTAVALDRDDVRAYFESRPWGSRIGAWASAQSQHAQSRAEIEAAYTSYAEQFPDTGEPGDVPLPDFWGGYRIACDEVEFWAGRRSRLHDRLVFERTGTGDLADAGSWRVVRRQP